MRTQHRVRGKHLCSQEQTMSKIMMTAAFGAGYVLGTKAGRERYEQISAKAQELWGHPKVQEQADKVKEQAGKVTEQAKGRLKKSTDGGRARMDDPWDVDTDTTLADDTDSAFAGDDLEGRRG